MVFVTCHSNLIKGEDIFNTKDNLEAEVIIYFPITYHFLKLEFSVILLKTGGLPRHFFIQVYLFDFTPNWTEIC